MIGWNEVSSRETCAIVRPYTRRCLAIVLFLLSITVCACGNSGNSSSAPAPVDACATLPRATAANFAERLDGFLNNFCYQKQNWEHDAQVRSSDGVHLTVQIWYSPSLFNWMTVQNRQGPVPDGAILVKEEHLSLTSPMLLWSLMVKDSDLSWDGWYWGIVFPKKSNQNATFTQAANGVCPEPQALLNGAGLYCLNCHASGILNQGTFASTAYLDAGAAVASHMGLGIPSPEAFMHSGLAQVNSANSAIDPADEFTGRLPGSSFTDVKSMPEIPCMVPEQLDHAVSAGQSRGGPPEFITADQCVGCHDASGTLSGAPPNMMVDPKGPSPANLSPYGEWRYSMMGLAGRDPIFFAQLDTESTLHKRLAGKKNGAAFIQDLCLRCHGVMGQRQFHLDRGNAPQTLFTRDELKDSKSKYGALARDGVSCAVCHHMTDDQLGEPSTYTGLFKVGPATELYGPYPSDPDPSGAKSGDSVIPLPMHNALGITPLQGSQIEQANLCASCHTIVLPVYDAKGNPVIENGQPKTEYEQTTFFEWLNSGFITIPCQQCHMPDSYQGNQLQFKIANIEDNTFPAVPRGAPSTRLPDADLQLEPRTSYGRHQLLGINVFALEMFDQFRTDLGLFKLDPNLPLDLAPKISGQRTAVAGSVQQAQTATAEIEVLSATKANGQLQADVEVQNLAGHNFPSGVSFRRAFLNFQVLDAGGTVLWASGNTNSDGVIVDGSGNPLATEFFSPNQQNFQPHFWTDNPISSDQQVEIYEELADDPQGQLTTSFLSLDHKVKDNRIQPKGRSFNGPNAGITAPVGTGDDPSYQRGCGCSVVRYQVPLTGSVAGAASVLATLYYQSIPPYYLRQRSEDGHGADTARLVKFASELNVSKYAEIADWKLQIATSGVVNLQ
jgi:hypothetical protein